MALCYSRPTGGYNDVFFQSEPLPLPLFLHFCPFLTLFRESDYWPYVSIVKPDQYAGVHPAQVMSMLDWNNETIRDRYQAVTLQEGSPVSHVCRGHDRHYFVSTTVISKRIGTLLIMLYRDYDNFCKYRFSTYLSL